MMRRGLVLVGILILAALPAVAQDPIFDREAFIAKVTAVFQELNHLLREGDEFDFQAAMLFSGLPNESQEHLVVVPLTANSVSVDYAKQVGSTFLWTDIGTITLFGLYLIEGTDCISILHTGQPYLAVCNAWNRANIIDAQGDLVREFKIWWHRGDSKRAYFKFSGDNMEIHLETCFTASSNQW